MRWMLILGLLVAARILVAGHGRRHQHGERRQKCERYLKNLRKRNVIYGTNATGRFAPARCYQPYCALCPVASCRRRCPNLYQKPPNFYDGKDWYGPKYGCKCNPRGSEISTCDIVTGQCRCKPNYIGLKCDSCQPGYWEHEIEGCIRCRCDEAGSLDDLCDLSGQCVCKPGVGGKRCDRCQEKYYGFSESGCEQCQACLKPGHVCDQRTGACVCPPLREGSECQNCVKDTWLTPEKTCIECECSETGSIRSQCNTKTGQCSCKQGFEGDKCNRCSHGYYGYPKCRRCGCSPVGTDPYKGRCDKDSICQCDEQGHCPCKANVVGKRCNTCKENTFGLDLENPEGCTRCFCFGRSDKCVDGGFTWDQERSSDRVLTLVYNPLEVRPTFISNDINAVREIPSTYADVAIEPSNEPPYWRLPINFSGDLTLSYGGYLRFVTRTFGSTYVSQDFVSYPLVQLHGKEAILEPYNVNRDEIKIHEYYWTERNRPISREQLMVVLQNVTKILIKATDSVHFANVTLSNVSLDKATEIRGKPPPRALSVEKCECPEEYSGNSCQDPNTGYFRYFPISHDEAVNFTWIDKVVGQAKPCDCNDFTGVCDRESGYCLNCTQNRAGPHCERCAEGYYMDEFNTCQPCQCPNIHQNFASSCTVNYDGSFRCFCKPGYTSSKCNICDRGFFGNLQHPEGKCQPCNCDPDGSTSSVCNMNTGKCACRPGFTGIQCSQCEAPRHVIENHRCTPCDNCTQILLDDLDDLSYELQIGTEHLENGVQPPWEDLKNFEFRYESLKEDLETHRENKRRAQRIVENTNLDFYDRQLPYLEDAVKNRQNTLHFILEDGRKLLEDSENLEKRLDDIKRQLRTIIDTLNNFGTSHESTKSALAKARKWYKEMNEIAKKFRSENEYRRILEDCSNVARHASDLNTQLLSSNSTQYRLNDFKRRLEDLEIISVQSELVNQKAEKLNALNKARIANLSKVLESFDLEGKVSGIGQDIKDVEGLREKINELINQTQMNYEKLKDNEAFMNALKELERKEKNLKENLPDIDRYLELVTVHVDKLERNVSEYKKILNFADEEWKKTIDTYRQLESDTKAAKEAALKAKQQLEEAYAIIKPLGKDSINDKASLAYAASTRTLARIQNHQEIQDIRNLPINIAAAGLDLQFNGKMNNEQTSKLRQIVKNNKIVDLYGIIQQAIDVSGQMQKVYQNIQNINYTMYYDLSKDYQKYLNLTNKEQMDKLKQKINLARDHLQHIFTEEDTALDKIKNFNSKIGTNHTRIASIEMKLEELRAKIQRAKEAADGIKVSLTGSSCTRTYVLNNLEPSIFTSLLVDIKNVTDRQNDYSLFYIENENRNQYMDLRINKGRVVFKWQLSKEPHSLSVEGRNFGKILVERVAHRVTLRLGEVSKTFHELGEESPIFHVTRKNPVVVGKASGIPGCIKEIFFNGQRIGFWNFKETQGECSGCIRLHSPDTLLTYFNGNGYSNVSRENHNQIEPRHISIGFDVNTFDENALLLLAPQQRRVKNEERCSTFLAVYLIDGHIQAEVHYIDRPPLVVRTPEKFNTGTEHHIEILKSYEGGIDTLILNKNQVIEQEVPRQSVLRIKHVDFYFGGIPPEYKLDPELADCLPNITEGLLGSIEGISGKGGVAIQLTDGEYYGLEALEGELKHKRAWFSGAGYIILNPHPVENISFVIRTNQSNGFILSVGEFTVFGVEVGKLNVKFLGDNNSLLSDIPINDDEYYYVELTKGRNLKINGMKQGNVATSGRIENSEIYIGFNPKIPSANFTGGITDLIINNKPIYFTNDTMKIFSKVRIGHSWKKVAKINFGEVGESNTLRYPLNIGIKDMQNTEGCFKITSFTLDRNAAKFGDSISEPSFVIHFLKNSFWKMEYELEFEFRTLYPDGLLFLARNIRKGHYNLLQLNEGRIQFQSKNNRRKLENSIDKKVNDGLWHKVIVKHGKKTNNVHISVDGEGKVVKVVKNRVSGELFIGGLPNDVSDLISLASDLELQPFRGCIRGLKINKEYQSLVDKHTRHNKIGQCFSNIEQGSYFGGDAYALYKNEFEMKEFLEINLEFRTTEQNGILLSISSDENTPALSIELQNGAVVMTVDTGFGYVSNVTNSLTDYALCNNGWHNVSALYSSYELTVNVDGVRKSWVVQDDISSMDIKAPLYIGGLPDDAPVGTLKTRENFKGCIRNVKIGENPMDWTDMDELNNVLLNSCPVVA